MISWVVEFSTQETSRCVESAFVSSRLPPPNKSVPIHIFFTKAILLHLIASSSPDFFALQSPLLRYTERYSAPTKKNCQSATVRMQEPPTSTSLHFTNQAAQLCCARREPPGRPAPASRWEREGKGCGCWIRMENPYPSFHTVWLC
jgi:hypothetical protein